MIRVDVNPELLRWARKRAGIGVDRLAAKFPKYRQWETREVQPTLRQLESLAKTTHVAVGLLFLPQPPDEPLPIPDFRTKTGANLDSPGPDLLDTIYLCQRRQAWYQDFARRGQHAPLAFVGSASPTDSVETVAAEIRRVLGLDLARYRSLATWSGALQRLGERAEALGVLVMISGVVGSSTSRVLNPDEFRGFALADDLAPLIFINGADTKAAQMFTLAHELAHLWLGDSALSNSRPDSLPTGKIERWCNRVAAEVLVPLAQMHTQYRQGEKLADALNRLARHFKVSKLVILRRIRDGRYLSADRFRTAYAAELENFRQRAQSGGGHFYNTTKARLGNRFSAAVVASTLEGETSFTESFDLLGLKKMNTFDNLARHLGILRDGLPA